MESSKTSHVARRCGVFKFFAGPWISGGQNTGHCHAVIHFINSWHDIWRISFWGPNSLRSDRWTPGRMKSSIYHAHEFYKTNKKRGNDLDAALPCEDFGDTALSKWEGSNPDYCTIQVERPQPKLLRRRCKVQLPLPFYYAAYPLFVCKRLGSVCHL